MITSQDIAGLLCEIDPVGLLTYGQPQDEYNREAELLATQLDSLQKEETEAKSFLAQFFKQRFGIDLATDKLDEVYAGFQKLIAAK